MNVLFLDHDGVSRTNNFHYNKRRIKIESIEFDLDIIPYLKKIFSYCNKNNIKVIITSAYILRKDIDIIRIYKKLFKYNIFIKVDIKDIKMNESEEYFRSSFIRNLIDFDDVDNYIIVDDFINLFSEEDNKHIIPTNQIYGLNKNIFKLIIRRLNKWI